jgi:hypothetical protein
MRCHTPFWLLIGTGVRGGKASRLIYTHIEHLTGRTLMTPLVWEGAWA